MRSQWIGSNLWNPSKSPRSFSRLNGNLIRNRYLKYWMSLEEYTLECSVEFANEFDNTAGKTGDVERSPTPTPPLVLGLWAESWSWKSWFLFQRTSLSCLISSEYKWVRRETMGRVPGSRSELILYFKSKFQTWVSKLRGDSASRVLFSAGLRHLSGLRCAQLKLFSSGGTFR